MTTSFTLNTTEAIDEAIRMAGGEPSQFEELRSARNKLNLLLLEWQTRGINLWKLELQEVSITASTAQVFLSSDVVDTLDIVAKVSTNSDLMMNRLSYKDYLALTNKQMTASRPMNYMSERLNDQVRITLWPVQNQDMGIKYWAIKRFNDVTGPRSSVDVPQRFLPCLTYGLAYKLFFDRSKGTQEDEARLNRLEKDYNRTWDMAYEEDRDRTSFTVIPSKYGSKR